MHVAHTHTHTQAFIYSLIVTDQRYSQHLCLCVSLLTYSLWFVCLLNTSIQYLDQIYTKAPCKWPCRKYLQNA